MVKFYIKVSTYMALKEDSN